MKRSDPRCLDHRIPLAPAIAAELRALRDVIGPRGWVFPSPVNPDQAITESTLEKAYRETLGLRDRHTPHGWRSTISSQAKGHKFDSQMVELALDHIHDTEVARAYDRGERFDQRIALFNWWGERLRLAQQGLTSSCCPVPQNGRMIKMDAVPSFSVDRK